MRKTTKSPGEKNVNDIKRAARKRYISEEKIWIALDGLRGEDRCDTGTGTPTPIREYIWTADRAVGVVEGGEVF